MSNKIGIWSRTLNIAENKYTNVRNCLGVLYGIMTCHPYLFVPHFDVFTDHKCLWWLIHIADPSGRLMHWRLRLSEYDLQEPYRK